MREAFDHDQPLKEASPSSLSRHGCCRHRFDGMGRGRTAEPAKPKRRQLPRTDNSAGAAKPKLRKSRGRSRIESAALHRE
jgi:hypothetical protein